MDTIRDVLTGLMQELKTRKLPKNDPETILKKVLSKKELPHVKFRYLRKGILGLTVDSSAWLYQLNLQKQQLLGKLRKKSCPAENLRFYIGEIK